MFLSFYPFDKLRTSPFNAVQDEQKPLVRMQHLLQKSKIAFPKIKSGLFACLVNFISPAF